MGISALEAQSALLSNLGTAIKGIAPIDRVEELLLDWPIELSLVVVRASLCELLTTNLICRRTASPRTLGLIFHAINVLPENPIGGRFAVASDYVSRLLLKSLGFTNLAPDDLVPFSLPPKGWVEFGEWIEDLSPLALPDFSFSSHIIRGRELDLARAASFAALDARALSYARMLRWLPLCLPGSPETKCLLELLAYAEERPDNQEEVTFHLSIVQRQLSSLL